MKGEASTRRFLFFFFLVLSTVALPDSEVAERAIPKLHHPLSSLPRRDPPDGAAYTCECIDNNITAGNVLHPESGLVAYCNE
jgi:hypothetical protein